MVYQSLTEEFLVMCAASGVNLAIKKLWEDYKMCCGSEIVKFISVLSFEEMESIRMNALYKACVSFDFKREVKFSNYVYFIMKGALCNEFKSRLKKNRRNLKIVPMTDDVKEYSSSLDVSMISFYALLEQLKVESIEKQKVIDKFVNGERNVMLGNRTIKQIKKIWGMESFLNKLIQKDLLYY